MFQQNYSLKNPLKKAKKYCRWFCFTVLKAFSETDIKTSFQFSPFSSKVSLEKDKKLKALVALDFRVGCEKRKGNQQCSLKKCDGKFDDWFKFNSIQIQIRGHWNNMWHFYNPPPPVLHLFLLLIYLNGP